MLFLRKDAKDFEKFHLQRGRPVPKVKNIFGIIKRVSWDNIFLEDGTKGTFTSWWVIGNWVHWYSGSVKCDGTRTRMYWARQLDDGTGVPYTPDIAMYVMTTTQKEKSSVRFMVDPGDPTWDNMGGS